GRNVLLATSQKFDVIISEPSNPWQAGVCNLFTSQYFDICKRRLKPGGIFACWVQIVEIPPENLKGILSSLNAVFPHTLALRTDPGNIVVLAGDRPLVADWRRLRWLMGNTAIASELARIDINSPEAVLAHMVAGSDGLRKTSEGTAPNVDDTNRLEYAVARTYETKFFNIENAQMLDANAGNLEEQVDFGDLDRQSKANLLVAIGREGLMIWRNATALKWTDASLAVAHSAEGLRVKGIALQEQGRVAEAEKVWDECLTNYPRHIETLQTRGAVALRAGNREQARKFFLKVLEI